MRTRYIDLLEQAGRTGKSPWFLWFFGGFTRNPSQARDLWCFENSFFVPGAVATVIDFDVPML